MVTGIERWKEYFNDYKDKYVLIGGEDCHLPLGQGRKGQKDGYQPLAKTLISHVKAGCNLRPAFFWLFTLISNTF